MVLITEIDKLFPFAVLACMFMSGDKSRSSVSINRTLQFGVIGPTNYISAMGHDTMRASGACSLGKTDCSCVTQLVQSLKLTLPVSDT